MNKKLSIVVTVALALIVMFGSTATVQAQGEVCEKGQCTTSPNSPQGSNDGGTEAEGLGGFYTATLRGGYTAAGVGLRNRGFGTIKLTGIPVGAKVTKAFLYWNIVDAQQQYRHQKVTFAGHALVGTFIGADMQPCWLDEYYSTYSYRVDVTRYVTKNGSYTLKGVAS